MVKIFQERVKTLQNQLQKQQSNINNRYKWTLSLVMVTMMVDQLQKFVNAYFQHLTLENFANFHKDPNIKQCWTNEEWLQWHRNLILLRQQLPPMENIALAA